MTLIVLKYVPSLPNMLRVFFLKMTWCFILSIVFSKEAILDSWVNQALCLRVSRRDAQDSYYAHESDKVPRSTPWENICSILVLFILYFLASLPQQSGEETILTKPMLRNSETFFFLFEFQGLSVLASHRQLWNIALIALSLYLLSKP